jgi:enediyne biosynthesis protein E5
MSVTALPTATRPPIAPPAKPRPPFRPVILFLGIAGTLALLAAQDWFEFSLVPTLQGMALLPILEIMVNVVLFAAAAVVFFRLTLRQISPMYHAPVFITVILIGAHFYYGVLENFTPEWLGALTGGWVTSYSPTFVTILAAIGAELLFARFAYGKWPSPVSAYITGISAGILIKSPELWPFVLCAVISIASKYALRVRGRHLWNPTNFGVTVLLLLAPLHTASLSVQYGNVIWSNVLIWTLGALILWKIGKLHIPVAFAVVYLLLSPYRAWATGNAWLTEVAPLTGPMYQLFMFFMITDPKTTTRYKWSQCLVAGLVAVAEMCFRLAPTWFGRAPEFLSFDAAYLALFVVGPAANLIEIWWNAGKARPTTTGAMKSQL